MFSPASWAAFTISAVSGVICICSESILCLVRSSTSMSLKLPKLMCEVTNALFIPLISIRFINSRLKCNPAPGAETAPSFRAKIVWKRSSSSGSTGRVILWGSGVSPSLCSSFLNSSCVPSNKKRSVRPREVVLSMTSATTESSSPK